MFRGVRFVLVLVLPLMVPSNTSAQDADGDGVPDDLDVCCNTQPGSVVDDRGIPAGDMSGDCDVDLDDYAKIFGGEFGELSVYTFFANNFTGAIGPLSCPLIPLDDGTEQPAGGIPDLIIAEINPGDFIRVYNTTDAELDLTNVAYQWCAPFRYSPVASSVVVPAHGFATLNWPGNFFTTTDADGEIILYMDDVGFFNDPTRHLDYVCWGPGAKGRKTQTESVGKWSGDCAGSIPAGGTIARKVLTTGTTSDSYELRPPSTSGN